MVAIALAIDYSPIIINYKADKMQRSYMIGLLFIYLSLHISIVTIAVSPERSCCLFSVLSTQHQDLSLLSINKSRLLSDDFGLDALGLSLTQNRIKKSKSIVLFQHFEKHFNLHAKLSILKIIIIICLKKEYN